MRYTAPIVFSFLIAACSSEPDSSNDNAGGGGSGGGDTGGEASGGQEQGGGGQGSDECDPDRPCGQDEYCDYADGLCGTGEPTGKCVAAPQTDCGPQPTICGCDGQLYRFGACDAALAGIDVGPATPCTPPEGTIACGQSFCDKTTQYCLTEVEIGADSDECAAWTRCEGLPSCEGSPTLCACIETSFADNYGVQCAGDETSGVLAAVTSPDCQ